jgi:uncharacterized protein with NRDE domain
MSPTYGTSLATIMTIRHINSPINIEILFKSYGKAQKKLDLVERKTQKDQLLLWLYTRLSLVVWRT